jgi:hypothetical protein
VLVEIRRRRITFDFVARFLFLDLVSIELITNCCVTYLLTSQVMDIHCHNMRGGLWPLPYIPRSLLSLPPSTFTISRKQMQKKLTSAVISVVILHKVHPKRKGKSAKGANAGKIYKITIRGLSPLDGSFAPVLRGSGMAPARSTVPVYSAITLAPPAESPAELI